MTNSPNFLKSIVGYFTSGNKDLPPLSSLTFILPNKRSGLFLKKYFRDISRGITLMPRIMTIGTFVGIYSDYPAAQPRELLFVLYDAYRRVMARKGRAEDIRQFDGFLFWGEMMLNDFDDIDKSLVKADDIFRNLKNVKEIQADYLDEDQKEVIRRVWGESRLTAHVEEFWLHLGNGEECMLSQKFVYLWEILADIYHEYKDALKASHRASEGSQYRCAVDNTRNFDLYDFTGDTRYVFIGFNDLSAAETMIFERFRRAGVAYFFWDTAPLALFAEARGASLPLPLQRLADLAKNYPMPADYTVPLSPEKPKITITAVPSNVAQAKCIGGVIQDWIKAKYIKPENAINTAIVLPDQGLLLPALLSIPDDIESLNISMGLAYRTTTFASLFHSIISMQLRARQIHGEYSYYFEDINAVLSHPHIQAIAPRQANAITAYINGNKLYNAPASDLCRVSERLAYIFTPVRKSASAREVAAYLGTLIDRIGADLTKNIKKSGHEKGKAFEIEALKYFREELDKLTGLIERYKVDMSDRTFLSLFERIFSARGLTLKGTPLSGLQVLGVLETRAIDFENVIILSMNESIFPRKQYAKTMIPNNLRDGFGLPDFESPEWTYAYSFYRLISRAKHVALFYDSRSEGMGQGEKSRYISQLEYLVPGLDIKEQTLTTGAVASDLQQFTIAKDEKIQALLSEFLAGGGRLLSASALKKYLECPFRFYLEYVRRLRDEDTLSESLSSAEIGTIVHNSIQSLYAGHANQSIDAALIDSWLDETNPLIRETVDRQIREVHFAGSKTGKTGEFSPEIKIAATNLEILVRSNLEAERDAYCRPSFKFIENEYTVNTIKDGTTWQITPDYAINFYMAIDRVDEVAPKVLRFIDFKSGTDETGIKDLTELTSNYKHAKGGMFQLLLYSEAYLSLCQNDVEIQPYLHPLRGLAAARPIKPLSANQRPITVYSQVRDTFKPMLENLIKEIFDPAVPFRQCEDSSACEFCPFMPMCGRTVKKY